VKRLRVLELVNRPMAGSTVPEPPPRPTAAVRAALEGAAPFASPDQPVLASAISRGAGAVASALSSAFATAQTALSSADAEAAKIAHEAEAAKIARGAAVPPWRTLGEQFSILEPALKAKLMAPREELFCGAAAAATRRAAPNDILPGCLPAAQAALAEDATLRELRYRLVPSTITEEDFWRSYFWRCANVKCELLHDFATVNRARMQEALDDDAALATELADDEPTTPGGPLDALADAELDLEFERLVHSASKW